MQGSGDAQPITALLHRWRSGDQDAGNQLIALVYDELHRNASREMRREHGENTLQTTAVSMNLIFESAGPNRLIGKIALISTRWQRSTCGGFSWTMPAVCIARSEAGVFSRFPFWNPTGLPST